MFRQESMYYLSGYDSFGYVFFQCLYLGADGTLTLLTRSPDLRQAQHTSLIEDIRVWADRDGATPAGDLKAILDEHGCRGMKLGVELEAYGLTGAKLAHARGRPRRLLRPGRRFRAGQPAARGEEPDRDSNTCGAPPSWGDAALDEANRLARDRRLRGRHPGRHAGRRVQGRRRLSGQ